MLGVRQSDELGNEMAMPVVNAVEHAHCGHRMPNVKIIYVGMNLH